MLRGKDHVHNKTIPVAHISQPNPGRGVSRCRRSPGRHCAAGGKRCPSVRQRRALKALQIGCANPPFAPPRAELQAKLSPEIINLDRMTIVGRADTPRTTSPATACVPGWRELLEGPAGRRVFEWCHSGGAGQAVTAGPARTARAERLIAPQSPHDRLIDFGRVGESSKASRPLIGTPRVPGSE